MAKILNSAYNQEECKCPKCESICHRHSVKYRSIKDLSRTLHFYRSIHYCKQCKKHFSFPIDRLTKHNRVMYTDETTQMILYCRKRGKSLAKISSIMNIPISTICDIITREMLNENCRTEC